MKGLGSFKNWTWGRFLVSLIFVAFCSLDYGICSDVHLDEMWVDQITISKPLTFYTSLVMKLLYVLAFGTMVFAQQAAYHQCNFELSSYL